MRRTPIIDVNGRKRWDSTTHLGKNMKMDDDVYKLRRQVIDLLYELKRIKPDLPRITVRITEDKGNTLGVGRLNENIIWISKKATNQTKPHLRQTVYHEVLHTVYAVPHVEGDALMDVYIRKNPLSKEKAQKTFLYWADKYGK